MLGFTGKSALGVGSYLCAASQVLWSVRRPRGHSAERRVSASQGTAVSILFLARTTMLHTPFEEPLVAGHSKDAMTEAPTEFERVHAHTLGDSLGAHGEWIAEEARFLPYSVA
jgi:hypothetical protein